MNMSESTSGVDYGLCYFERTERLDYRLVCFMYDLLQFPKESPYDSDAASGSY